MINNESPQMSIVVCTYNGEATILDCLNGLVAQNCLADKFEILIIDDGSTDRTIAKVADFIENQNNNALHIRFARINHGGLSIARNTGIFLSRGEIVSFIDQDAVPEINWANEMLKAWENVPDADGIGGRVDIKNSENRIAQFLFWLYYERAESHAIIGTNMSFKKHRLLQVGAFGDSFVSRGDETFLLRKMGSGRKEVKWAPAIVFHDWPITVGQWLRERLSNGKMSRVISRIFNDKESNCGVLIRKRILGISIIMIVLLFDVSLGLLLLFGLLLARSVRQGDLNILHRKYFLGFSLLLALFWQILKEIGDWLFCFGRWRGKGIPISVDRAMKGTVSSLNLIDEIANK